MSEVHKPKSRLGRGLSSLISISAPVEADAPPLDLTSAQAPLDAPPGTTTRPSGTPTMLGLRPTELPLTSIVPNPHQPRRAFNDAGLAELAASMKSNGVIQPIVVRQMGDPSTNSGQATSPNSGQATSPNLGQATYELIAGERRFRAAKLAGLTTIPAILRDVDSFTQAQMALVENIQREDLNPLDRAQGYRTLLDQLGLTQAELSARLGEERSSIANFLRLLDLAEPVQTLVREGRLSAGHAKLLAGVSDTVEQERLAHLVVGQELSVRNLERLLTGAPAPVAAKALPGSAHALDLEKSLARQLGMRVQLKEARKKGKGRLVIHYASLDQFDELLNRLGVQADA
ncbi:MAG: ParB/RepB/Spo0J family partition protein [Planctomycetota bacterium]|nr:ParB/RepB/Spo0J family partition protein [Planctomycetota bacterium]